MFDLPRPNITESIVSDIEPLPEPEPPITSTFLLRAVLGSLGRLLMVRRSVWVRITLFWNTGST